MGKKQFSNYGLAGGQKQVTGLPNNGASNIFLHVATLTRMVSRRLHFNQSGNEIQVFEVIREFGI
jgi:hypothetical protein